MNGKEYDRILKELDTIKKSDNSDVKKFCIDVRDWVLFTRDYRHTDLDTQTLDFFTKYTKGSYGSIKTIRLHTEYLELDECINKEIFNEDALNYAREVFRTLKDFYSSQLARKILQYHGLIKKEISKRRSNSNLFRVLDYTLQTIIILGATIIPFILIITELPKTIPTIISAIVAVAAALSRYYKFGERSVILYAPTEEMQKELTLHESERGPYSGLTKGVALDLFMDAIDKIRQEQQQTYISLEKKIQDQAKELEQMRGKSK